MIRFLSPVSAILLLFALGAVAGTSVLFVRAVVPLGMFPLIEFDANQPVGLPIETDTYRIMVFVQVPESKGASPQSEVVVRSEDGDAIEL